MKSNTFNYSLLAVGVATLMGLNTAHAATASATGVTGAAAPIGADSGGRLYSVVYRRHH